MDLAGDAPPYPDCPHTGLGRMPKPRRRVISASKRTDVPAFYLPWLIERCEAGWLDVPNPMFRYATDPLKRLTHVSLLPEHVTAIVWWSKNYGLYRKHHRFFERYKTQYFHFTVNPRRPDLEWLEPGMPSIEEALEQFRFLASLPGGPDMVAWRYDPICFWSRDGEDLNSWDPRFFEQMCRELSNLGVQRCFLSFAHLYGRAVRRVARAHSGTALREPAEEEMSAIAAGMRHIAGAHHVRLLACTEPQLLRFEGFTKGACVDGGLLGGRVSAATDRKMRGREECGCTVHTDIGDYVDQECGYSCIYCYANPSRRLLRPAPPLGAARPARPHPLEPGRFRFREASFR
jgi:hypothetical protein